MNILYAPIVNYEKIIAEKGIEYCGDYVVDCLFHGFRKTFGDRAVDWQKNPVMYKGFEHADKFPHRGFSMFGRIDDTSVDRTDIVGKLSAGFFDYVVCPIHHTNRNNQEAIAQHINTLLQYFPPSKIAVICSDETPSSNSFLFGRQEFVFFKQELLPQHAHQAYPISYSIPAENIVTEAPVKSTHFAPLMPSFLRRGHPHEKTYIYTDEKSYFNQYQHSYFGFTCMKGGWDCMRHYEIVGCGCLPYFTDIERCPPHTLASYPKNLAMAVKKLEGLQIKIAESWKEEHQCGTVMDLCTTEGHEIDMDKFNSDKYWFLWDQFMDFARQEFTTEARAKYIISSLMAQGG